MSCSSLVTFIWVDPMMPLTSPIDSSTSSSLAWLRSGTSLGPACRARTAVPGTVLTQPDSRTAATAATAQARVVVGTEITTPSILLVAELLQHQVGDARRTHRVGGATTRRIRNLNVHNRIRGHTEGPLNGGAVVVQHDGRNDPAVDGHIGDSVHPVGAVLGLVQHQGLTVAPVPFVGRRGQERLSVGGSRELDRTEEAGVGRAALVPADP